MPDNYGLCKKRLFSLKSRLDKDVGLNKRCDSVFQEQLECGVIENVNYPGTLGGVSYLPHRAVINENKSSTKLRMVFDASARTMNGVCLNEILYKGPSLNTELYELLLKFRIYPMVLIADIEKAYLQIEVDESHRDFLRFLLVRKRVQ